MSIPEAFLVIHCGYEGIEELCYLTTEAKFAITKIIELRANIERDDVWPTNPDAYCIQKWDGEKFKCVCSELGVEPKEPWLMG